MDLQNLVYVVTIRCFVYVLASITKVNNQILNANNARK